jgi:hypothetical protein
MGLRKVFWPKRDEVTGERRKLHNQELIDWRIILRWIFKKWDVEVWTGLGWLRIGTVGGHLLMR